MRELSTRAPLSLGCHLGRGMTVTVIRMVVLFAECLQSAVGHSNICRQLHMHSESSHIEHTSSLQQQPVNDSCGSCTTQHLKDILPILF
jgi:hypothetical protein